MPSGRPTEVVDLDDLPASELAFRFHSGRLCLAFCATVGERWRRCFERLRTPGDLGRWLAQAGLADEPAPVSPDLLATARTLREAIYRLVLAAMAGHPGQDRDRRTVNDLARHQPLAPQIDPDGERRWWPGLDPASAALATVAVDAVDLLTSEAIGRVRECDSSTCALLFLDSSRPGRRRWCADRACGSRSRVAAYRLRHAAAPQPARLTPAARRLVVGATVERR